MDITLGYLLLKSMSVQLAPANDQTLPRSSQILWFERKHESIFQFRQRIRDERGRNTLVHLICPFSSHVFNFPNFPIDLILLPTIPPRYHIFVIAMLAHKKLAFRILT